MIDTMQNCAFLKGLMHVLVCAVCTYSCIEVQCLHFDAVCIGS